MPQLRDEQSSQTLTLRVHRGGFNANQSSIVTRKTSQSAKPFQPNECAFVFSQGGPFTISIAANRSKVAALPEPRDDLPSNSFASPALQQPKLGTRIEECNCELIHSENGNRNGTDEHINVKKTFSRRSLVQFTFHQQHSSAMQPCIVARCSHWQLPLYGTKCLMSFV